VRQIYLDNDNPRHDPIDNEAEVIAHLVGDEKVIRLARDIAEHGLSPIDVFAVMPHPKMKGSYVVLEGNRRLCALKLLKDPDKAPKESHRKVLRALAQKASSVPTSIEACEFPDRGAARIWLARRHEGAQDGVGVRNWTTGQIARFNKTGDRPSNPNVQATELLEYAVKAKLISKQEHDRISVTTLTRFLSNPVFRSAIGLTSGKNLEIHARPADFNRVVERFLKDAITRGSDVHSRTSKSDREAYARKLQKQGLTPPAESHAVTLDPATGQPRAGAGTTIASPRNNKSPDKRSRVIPSDFSVHLKDKVLKRLYDELRTLSAEDFPFAAAYLFRAVIEKAIKLYAKKVGSGYAANTELHVIVKAVADSLEKSGVGARDVKPLRRMESDKHGPLSPDTLGAYVHGGLIPTSAELARAWDEIEGILKMIMERLK